MNYLAKDIVSWLPERELSFEQWEGELLQAIDLHNRLPWILGDMLLYGERMFGEDYAAAIPEGTWASETLRAYLWVSTRIDPSRRVAQLYWTHHRVVAGLKTVEEQDAWLRFALVNNWSTRELKERIEQANGRKTDKPDEQDGTAEQSTRLGGASYARQVEVLRGVLTAYLPEDDVEAVVQEFLMQLEVELWEV